MTKITNKCKHDWIFKADILSEKNKKEFKCWKCGKKKEE